MNNEEKRAASNDASGGNAPGQGLPFNDLPIPRPNPASDTKRLFSPVRFLIITIGGIFLAEIVAMIVITLFRELPYAVQTLIDASVMVVLIFPLVYSFSLKPLIEHIEERKRAEKALRQSEERFTKAFHSSPAALSITRIEDGAFIDINKSFLRLSQYARDEVIGNTSLGLNLYVNPDARVQITRETTQAEGGVRDYEIEARLKSGEIRTVLLSTEVIELDGEACVLTSISDITERKRAEEAVEKERQRLFALLETLPAYLLLLTPDYHVPFANRYFRERFGESQGSRCYEYLFGRDEPCETCGTYEVLSKNAPNQWEWTGPDGRIYDVFDYPFTDTDGSPLILEMGIDITERKQAEARLKRVNHALSVLNECNQLLIRAEDEAELLQEMCKILVNVGEYRMAWIGFAEQDEAQTVRVVAREGFEEGYLELAQVTWADTERGHGPTGTAIREGVVQVNQNFLSNPKMEPWRESALARGYQSSIALPLKDGDATIGALTIYAVAPDAFDAEEVHLLVELANDLMFGIQSLRVRTERNKAQEKAREMALFPTLNPDAVLQVDATGRIRTTNPTAARLGISAGAQLIEIIPDLAELDLPHCITNGTTQHIADTRLGNLILLWTVRGVPELGLAFLYSTDMTEYKQAEKRIHQLSRIVEQTEDTVLVTNYDGAIEYVNPAFERLTGYTREEVLGQRPSMIKSGLHNDGFYRDLWAAILNGEAFQAEIANRKKNGDVFFEAKTITPLRDAAGKITHFVATGKDITERKRDEEQLRKAYDELEVRVQERTAELRIANSELADEIHIRMQTEEALRGSEDRLKRAQEIAHLGSWELDLINNQLTWSDEVYRIFGLQPQQFAATYQAFLEVVHPEDRETVDAAYAESIREGRDRYEIEHRIVKRSNGEVRIVHEKCEHFRNNFGQIILSVGMVHDITERKHAEEALRAARDELELRVQERTHELAIANRDLLKEIAERKEIERQLRIQTTAMEAAANGIVITDREGTIQWTNPAMSQMSGYAIPEMIGQSMHILSSGRHSQEDYRQMWDTILSGEVWRGEITNRRKNGDLYVEEQTITPVPDDNEQIRHFIAIKQDITQQKRVEEALELERRRLRKIMDTMPDGVFIINPEFGVEYVNPVIEKAFGALDGRRCYDYFHDRQDPCPWCKNPEVLAGNTVLWEHHYVKTDRTYDVFETPFVNSDGSVSKFKMLHDITERKLTEQELAERNIQLQALSIAEREQRQLSEALFEAALVLNKSMKLEEVLPLILEQIKEVISYQLANITLLDGDTFYDASHAGDERWSLALGEMTNRFPLDEFPIMRTMRDSGQPVLIPDTRQQTNWRKVAGLEWCLSYLSTPLLVEEKVIGFVTLFSEQPGFFTQEMCNRLEAFAAHAAVAIQNAWLFEQVRASNERLQSLSRRLVEVQENERLYIARELHDEAGQMLTSLMLDLRVLEINAWQSDVILKKVAEMEVSLNDVQESLHRVAMSLRPATLDHLGLVAALRQHAEAVSDKYGLPISFKAGKLNKRLPRDMETELYRIVQEGLTNVVRHSHANHVDIVLTMRDDELVVIVEDDGIGFDPEAALGKDRMGLLSMRERAEMIGGKLVIESAPEKGTTLMVEVKYADTNSDNG